MPELPDIEAYLAALRDRIEGHTLVAVRVAHPFLLRSFDPPLPSAYGRTVRSFERLGKRIVIGLDGGLFLVLHLMIAGRLHVVEPGSPIPRRQGLAAFDFDGVSLLLTEAGTKRRASLHLVRGRTALAELDPGGLEVLVVAAPDGGEGGPPAGVAAVDGLTTVDLAAFRAALTAENHTVKRALTDPRVFSGIGNAYSDEILHRARMSPLRQTASLGEDEVGRLHEATVAVLREWTERLIGEARRSFPEKVTAFREGMAVHGRFGQPCPVCGTAVQRIVYAENECDYCPRCQTGGRLLADRSLSRLLKDDWPRTIEELERRTGDTRRTDA